MIVCCNFFRSMLDKVYVRIAENMKVKRPIEVTRLTLRYESERDHNNLVATLLYGYIGEFT